MQIVVGRTVVELVQGDITEQETEAIVNAANAQLVLGGGVAGAIRLKGGPAIQAECDQKAPIGVGQATLTTGGSLKARYVIHAVGPRMGEGEEDRKLAEATLSVLKIDDAHHLKSLSFCAISTGIFGFPMDRCARIMLDNTTRYVRQQTGLEKVVFCLYDRNAYDTFAGLLKGIS